VSTAIADDGVPIAYHVSGRRDGAPLLMLQGLGVDARGWVLQRFPLGRQFRCYAVDNRGVGGTANAELVGEFNEFKGKLTTAHSSSRKSFTAS